MLCIVLSLVSVGYNVFPGVQRNRFLLINPIPNKILKNILKIK